MSNQVLISAAPYPASSRLRPGLEECLSAMHCLPYFIQYLEYCKSIRLLHFLFACDTFREVADKEDPGHFPNLAVYPNSPSRSIKTNLQNDALDIYVKFVSMNAPHAINLPESTRRSIENKISTEDGKVDYKSFDCAVEHVKHVLRESTVPNFHKSSFCTAFQLEVLRKDVCLADILLHESCITYYMEFLEQRNQENHVLFWISVQAFQEHLKSLGTSVEGNVDDVGADAIALYDTYLSLQARKPVNYGRIIRGIVESCISPDDGIITPDAFLISQQYSYHYMDKFFFELYLKSDQYKRFKRELASQLDMRRREEHNIKLNSASRSTNREISERMNSLAVSSPSPKPLTRETSRQNSHSEPPTTDPRPAEIPCKHPDSQTPCSSSVRSISPCSSRASTPRSRKRNKESAPNHTKGRDPGFQDILDDSEFWERPDKKYDISAVDEWGVYRAQDNHLLHSPPQGSEKIKKSVMRLFGKEEISEEDAMAQAKSIVSDVMSLTSKPQDWGDIMADE